MVTPHPNSLGDAMTRPVGRGSHPAPGTRLGDYRLDRVIGEGGMGVVYLGLDAEHHVVAVKVLKPHIAGDPQARQRLAREVSTLERVRSPRVAEVIAADVDGPWPHLVTRYVPGPSLETVIAESGPLRGPALRELGHGLAEALTAIHRAGVVHRDLKPANVLLLDGRPVVIDFGIAHVADDVRLTSTGLVMGTPGYLSPEVVAGGTVSPATDWWGWAATTAYAATGRPPFGRGPMEAVLDRVRRADVDLAGLSTPLRDGLLAALAVNPAHRPSPQEILRVLDEVAAGSDGRTSALTHGDPSSRFASLIAPEEERPPADAQPTAAFGTGVGPDATTVLPAYRPAPTGPAASGAAPAVPPPGPPADATAQLPRVQQAPPGWIPSAPGPDPARRPVPPPVAPTPGRGRPAGQAGPPLGTNGQPARPQRTWTIAAGLLALVGVFAVAPTAGLVIAVLGATLFRTVDRTAAGLFRRRWEAGPRASDAWVAGFSAPWNVLRSLLSTLLASILPVLVGISGAFLAGLIAGQGVVDRPDRPVLLALGGLLGLLTGWFGPGGASLQRGTRVSVRRVLAGERATGIVVGILLLVAVAAVITAAGGSTPDWYPLPGSPVDLL
ncbi:serine/threonine-protein kinase [Kineococcus gynurae]|uniref:Serine/threonine-protein kinase n=1 Tax=Kineococcus gynurae TaxID=452979 RepID=A0ABV5LPH0_9ACTN